ncbi:MAG: hypothetical protein ABI277_14325 [Burkholderiaceae bacterium]
MTVMWILVAEALGALGLFLFIVWWTLGPTQRREREALQQLASQEARRRAATEADAQSSESDSSS